MRRKGKESGLNVALTALLVVFVCLLSFSVGVISGKGWSDREYKIRHIENDSHLQAAKEDSAPIGDEMTQREVEMLTQRAMEEAQAQAPSDYEETNAETVVKEEMKKTEEPIEPSAKMQDKEEPAGKEASLAMNKKSAKKEMKKPERKMSSVPTKPTLPKPTAIEYTVQVAAYKTIGEAEAHSQRLIDKGFPAFPVKALIKGDEWYRVSIGSFKNRKQAIKYEKALKKQAVVKSTFVRKITRRKTQ